VFVQTARIWNWPDFLTKFVYGFYQSCGFHSNTIEVRIKEYPFELQWKSIVLFWIFFNYFFYIEIIFYLKVKSDGSIGDPSEKFVISSLLPYQLTVGNFFFFLSGRDASDPEILFIISVSDPDPHWICIRLASWIRIRIRNSDPDPWGVKSAKTEEKNGAKRQKNSS
jgi:hypothetical protein